MMFRRFRISLLLLATAFVGISCGSSSTGQTVDDGNDAVPSAEGDYRITAMKVAESDSDELDITGDNQEDNQLPKALKEVADYLYDELAALVDEFALNQETATAIKATINALLKATVSVDSINAALESQMDLEIWLTRIFPPDGQGKVTVDNNAVVDYWQGYQELGESQYYLYDPQGELTGNYTSSSDLVDASDGQVAMTLLLIVQTYTYSFAFDLEKARTVQTFDPATLDGAKLGGAISTATIATLIHSLFDYINAFVPFIPDDKLDELEAEVDSLLDDISDITLDDGDLAISVTFVYDAMAAAVVEY